MKKNFAEFRFADQKVIAFPQFDTVAGGSTENILETASFSACCKRVLDFVFSLFVVVFGFPFFLLVGILIKLTSEGPVLFVQERIGKDGRPFKFYKFRTMTVGSDDEKHRKFAKSFINGDNCGQLDEQTGKRLFKITSDPRVTSIGRFLRRTSLDELPQFLNVLKGEMSIVGPRPPIGYEFPLYQEWHKKRLTVKPGLTGLWQVSGRSMVPFDEMVKLDINYIENWSFLLDIKIILRTIPVMLFGCGGY